jgi:hypothetical protein
VPVQRLLVNSEKNDRLVEALVTFPGDVYESHCVFRPVRRTHQWQRLQARYKNREQTRVARQLQYAHKILCYAFFLYIQVQKYSPRIKKGELKNYID